MSKPLRSYQKDLGGVDTYSPRSLPTMNCFAQSVLIPAGTKPGVLARPHLSLPDARAFVDEVMTSIRRARFPTSVA